MCLCESSYLANRALSGGNSETIITITMRTIDLPGVGISSSNLYSQRPPGAEVSPAIHIQRNAADAA